MAGTGSYFQTYLKRALANLEAADRERTGEPPAAPAFDTASTGASSSRSFSFSLLDLTLILLSRSLAPCLALVSAAERRHPRHADPLEVVARARLDAAAERQAAGAALDVWLCGSERRGKRRAEGVELVGRRRSVRSTRRFEFSPFSSGCVVVSTPSLAVRSERRPANFVCLSRLSRASDDKESCRRIARLQRRG